MLGSHMEDFREQITVMYFKKNNNKRFLSTTETNFVRSYTVFKLGSCKMFV